MSESLAVRQLKKKSGELRADLIQLNMQRRAVQRHISRIDDAIRILDGRQVAPIPHGRKRRWLFRRGELQRLVFRVLREAGNDISNRDIALAIISQMDWDTRDEELVSLIRGKVKDVRRRKPQF